MSDDDDPPKEVGDDEGHDPQDIDSAVDEQQRKKKKAKKQSSEREGEEFWLAVLGSPVGRRELWKIIAHDVGHAFQTKLNNETGFPDPNRAWYERGKQDFALYFYHQWLQLDHAAVAKMHQENDHRFKPRKAP